MNEAGLRVGIVGHCRRWGSINQDCGGLVRGGGDTLDPLNTALRWFMVKRRLSLLRKRRDLSGTKQREQKEKIVTNTMK